MQEAHALQFKSLETNTMQRRTWVALAATGGNKLAAAKMLGISRAKLYERLELAA